MDASVHLRNSISQGRELGADLMNMGRRSAIKSDEFNGLDNRSVIDVIPGGYHCESVKSADMAYSRPILVTVSADRTARLVQVVTLNGLLLVSISRLSCRLTIPYILKLIL